MADREQNNQQNHLERATRISLGSNAKPRGSARDMMEIDPTAQTHRNFKNGGEKMNVLQTMLALIASNIGGGIVGMPFAIFNCGAVLGTAVILFFGCITQLSVVLLLSTKDLTPRRYESLYEIGYLLLGRGSIFIMCTVLFFTTFGTCVLYFIIFGETLGSTMRQLILDHDLSRL